VLVLSSVLCRCYYGSLLCFRSSVDSVEDAMDYEVVADPGCRIYFVGITKTLYWNFVEARLDGWRNALEMDV
jgi:hypothetical protein